MARSTTKKNKGPRGRQNPRSRKQAHPSTDSSHDYSRYIRRVLKEVDPEKSISCLSLGLMNTVVNTIFERISTKACALMSCRNRRTLTQEDIQEAVHVLFPGHRARYAVTFGNEAVRKYVDSKNENLKEDLVVQERLKLFEPRDLKKV